jgi:hypothetical protein
MPLQPNEVQRLKQELGFNQLTLGAEPYIGITQYFEQIVLPNLQDSGLTSSSTTVAASGTPALVTLQLLSATSFTPMCRAVVDVDENQETAQVSSVVNNSIALFLSLAHAGTYPVAVEGGLSMVRDYLRKLRNVAVTLEKVPSRAGVQKVDTIGLETKAGQATQLDTLLAAQKNWRAELCQMLFGVGQISEFRRSGAGGSRIARF